MDDKKTLTVEDMENIFQLMDEDKKVGFDKNYIEELYTRYLSTGKVQESNKEEFTEEVKNKTVILIALGKSSLDERIKIYSEMKKDNTISISINFDYDGSNYIFLSNLRRYRELDESKYGKCIVTSNITSDKVYIQTRYRELLNSVESVRDNAGLMALKYLINCGVKEIKLAGFDGYSHEPRENYADSYMAIVTKNAVLDAFNDGMNEVLAQLSKEVSISFLTKPKYVRI